MYISVLLEAFHCFRAIYQRHTDRGQSLRELCGLTVVYKNYSKAATDGGT